MITLPTVIEENLVFGEGDIVVVDPFVTVAEGFSVRFEAGSQLIGNKGFNMEGAVEFAFGSQLILEDSAVISIDNTMSGVYGSLTFEPGSQLVADGDIHFSVENASMDISGTSDDLFEFRDADIFVGENSSLNLDYVYFTGGDIHQDDLYANSVNLTNSIIIPQLHLFLNSTVNAEGNIFVDTVLTFDQGFRGEDIEGLSDPGFEVSFSDNTVIGESYLIIGSWVDEIWREEPITFVNNNFLIDHESFFTIQPGSASNEHNIQLSGNYWGNDNLDEIKATIKDNNLSYDGPVQLDLSNRSDYFTDTAPLEIAGYSVDLEYLVLLPSEPQFLDQNSLWDSAISVGDGSFIQAEEAQVYRTYFGLLDRNPDQSGFNWWLNEIQEGRHDIQSMAAGFIGSDEFISAADANDDMSVSDEELLDHIYLSVFQREPDQEGYEWWLGQLELGSKDQAGVAVEMTQSDEFAEQTLNAVSDFILL